MAICHGMSSNNGVGEDVYERVACTESNSTKGVIMKLCIFLLRMHQYNVTITDNHAYMTATNNSNDFKNIFSLGHEMHITVRFHYHLAICLPS